MKYEKFILIMLSMVIIVLTYLLFDCASNSVTVQKQKNKQIYDLMQLVEDQNQALRDQDVLIDEARKNSLDCWEYINKH
jgi:preprotein translocase subunit Sec63